MCCWGEVSAHPGGSTRAIYELALLQLRIPYLGATCAWRASVLGLLGFIFLLAPPATAGPITYSLSDFTLINTCTDVFVPCPPPDGSVLPAGNAFSLIGGNNGSGASGVTDFVTTALSPILVQFQFSYSSFDFPGSDYAGYLINSGFHQLADIVRQASPPGQFLQFAVNTGDLFGFRRGNAG